MSTAVNRVRAERISVEGDLARVAETLRRSTVHVQVTWRGSGSGVIWRSDGLIITNAHVARESQMQIQLADGTRFRATMVARDVRRDLAVLRVNARDLPAVELGDAYTMRTGEMVIAVGNPWGAAGALTRGILHAAPRRDADWFESDIFLAPGNSGGPLADARGKVIGINSMIVNGLAFSVPVEAVQRFLQNVLASEVTAA